MMAGSPSQLPPNALFDGSKKPLFGPSNGFKALVRRLKSSGWKATSSKDELTVELLAGAGIVIITGPRGKYTAAEFKALQTYMDDGGAVLIMLGEGGENKFDTNVNFFLEQYGIYVNSDAVVRSSYYKYHHPKECQVANGVVNRGISRAAGKPVATRADGTELGTDKLSFLYPFGATLSVDKPSIPVLSSGTVSLPVNRPICAFHGPTAECRGKLAVLGSCHMFHDSYLDKEENTKVLDVIVQWLTTQSVQLDAIDADDPTITDMHYLPHTAKLSEQLRTCLQEGDDIPRDFTTLFDHSLHGIGTSLVPDALEAYEHLGVEHEPLKLVTPQFESPLPPLEPAVFAPVFREPAAPALDLFDLDDAFSSERVRLAQLTNKCNDDDLEYYMRECGEILGVTNRLPADTDKRDGKHILEYIFKQIVEFKKADQD